MLIILAMEECLSTFTATLTYFLRWKKRLVPMQTEIFKSERLGGNRLMSKRRNTFDVKNDLSKFLIRAILTKERSRVLHNSSISVIVVKKFFCPLNKMEMNFLLNLL